MIEFKYERLPTFCYACGMIGHIERDCINIPDEDRSVEKQWGTWLRASPRKGRLKLQEETRSFMAARKRLDLTPKSNKMVWVRGGRDSLRESSVVERTQEESELCVDERGEFGGGTKNIESLVGWGMETGAKREGKGDGNAKDNGDATVHGKSKDVLEEEVSRNTEDEARADFRRDGLTDQGSKQKIIIGNEEKLVEEYMGVMEMEHDADGISDGLVSSVGRKVQEGDKKKTSKNRGWKKQHRKPGTLWIGENNATGIGDKRERDHELDEEKDAPAWKKIGISPISFENEGRLINISEKEKLNEVAGPTNRALGDQ